MRITNRRWGFITILLATIIKISIIASFTGNDKVTLIGLQSLPILLMLVVVSQRRDDDFLLLNLCPLQLSLAFGIYALIDAMYLSPSPLGFLALPFAELFLFLLLTGVAECVKYFIGKSRASRQR